MLEPRHRGAGGGGHVQQHRVAVDLSRDGDAGDAGPDGHALVRDNNSGTIYQNFNGIIIPATMAGAQILQ